MTQEKKYQEKTTNEEDTTNKKENPKNIPSKKNEDKDQTSKIEELTNLLRHTQADFINYKQRISKEKEESTYYFKKEIITKLLPVLDMFELALKHKTEDNDFVKGMEMIYAQLIATLENEGLQIIPAKDKFDPKFHEAVLSEESDKEEGSILEILQKGYMLNNKVIRFSRVKVCKK